jgi:hypothetical protein
MDILCPCRIIQPTMIDGTSGGAVVIDFDFVDWDDEDDPRGNTSHIADNGLTRAEVEDVLYDPANRTGASQSPPHRPIVFGTTFTGRGIVVVYERHKDGRYVVVRPVTAYDVG